ncbi:MAG: hypoxanthine phosphoribosyltransferase, partial [Deltaproteobacteria bacterium]|nr:hypoxanthine phosphoribosyltransferase [Deltaproteobacteria bacterium]
MSSHNSKWDRDVEVLLDGQKLAQRVRELGAQITADYQGKSLCVVGILKGCFVFYADLVRALDLPLATEFIGISSYGSDTESSGVVQITSDLSRSIEGLDVLVVEDIIDTGLTMRYLIDNFQTRRPRSLKICTLLQKPDNTRVKVPIDYIGFTIP